MEKTPFYLIPYDFTPVTDAAVQHALSLARSTGATMQLLHLVKEQNQMEEKDKELAQVVDQLNLTDDDPKVESKAVFGSIFEDISRLAEYREAQLIVMGTHGARGLQKFMGSYAIKVITSSRIPFIVVQKDTPAKTYSKIVMPINLTKESVQVMQFAVNTALKFEAEIHLLGQEQGDEWLKKKIKSNMILVGNYFKKHGVRFKMSLLGGDKAYEKEVVEYGIREKADLFALAYFSDSILPQFDTFAQSLITNNADVPVLVVNAQQVGMVKNQYAFIGI